MADGFAGCIRAFLTNTVIDLFGYVMPAKLPGGVERTLQPASLYKILCNRLLLLVQCLIGHVYATPVLS